MQKGKRKRLNIELPISLFTDFEAIIKERKMAYAEGIREATRMWVKDQKKRKMAEGYKAMREKHMNLMEEFKYVDQELW